MDPLPRQVFTVIEFPGVEDFLGVFQSSPDTDSAAVQRCFRKVKKKNLNFSPHLKEVAFREKVVGFDDKRMADPFSPHPAFRQRCHPAFETDPAVLGSPDKMSSVPRENLLSGSDTQHSENRKRGEKERTKRFPAPGIPEKREEKNDEKKKESAIRTEKLSQDNSACQRQSRRQKGLPH